MQSINALDPSGDGQPYTTKDWVNLKNYVSLEAAVHATLGNFCVVT